MLGRRFTNSKPGLYLFTVGGIVSAVGISLALFVFGITYGTVCLIISGMSLAIYGSTFHIIENKRANSIMLLIRKLLSCFFLLGLISFVVIEMLIFQSFKSNDAVKTNYVVVLGAGIQ